MPRDSTQPGNPSRTVLFQIVVPRTLSIGNLVTCARNQRRERPNVREITFESIQPTGVYTCVDDGTTLTVTNVRTRNLTPHREEA